MDLGFEGLVVLALDLKFGLQLFHEHLETRDFGAKFLGVVAGDGAELSRRRWLRGRVVLAGMAGLRWRKVWRCRRCRARDERVGQCAGPRGFGNSLFGHAGRRSWRVRLRRRRWSEKGIERVRGAGDVSAGWEPGNVRK